MPLNTKDVTDALISVSQVQNANSKTATATATENGKLLVSNPNKNADRDQHFCLSPHYSHNSSDILLIIGFHNGIACARQLKNA